MLCEIQKFHVSFYAKEEQHCAASGRFVCSRDARIQTVPFFFLFSSLRHFLLGLAVHTLAVRDVAAIYTLYGMASECDSVVKSLHTTFYRPGWNTKKFIIRQPAPPGESGCEYTTRLRNERMKIQTCVWPTCRGSRSMKFDSTIACCVFDVDAY